MTLLEWALQKSGSGVTVQDVEEAFRLYGSVLQVLTERDSAGEIVAFAVLSPPMPMLGHTTCGLLLTGSLDRMASHRLFSRAKDAARAWGADRLLGSTHRGAEAIVRRYGGKIDSTNIVWDLKGENDAGETTRDGDGGGLEVSDVREMQAPISRPPRKFSQKQRKKARLHRLVQEVRSPIHADAVGRGR